MKSYIIDFDEELYESPYLDYDDEDLLHEWYSIEGAERLNELSRQLRTFLNFKTSLIHLRFSKSVMSANYSDIERLNKRKNEIINSMLQLISLLKKTGTEDKNISEKIQEILDKSRLNPQNSDLNIIKEIKTLNHNIWNLVHILSELEIHKSPKFFETILNISSVLCQVSAPLFIPFKRFYNELRTDYHLLDDELMNILNIQNNHQLSPNKKKIGVKITK
jgi:hypothetical protein